MRVLFVVSGNKNKGVSPITYNQGRSLQKQEISIDYFVIDKTGVLGYLSSIIPLRKKIRNSNYNVIHAHYFLTGIVALFALPKVLFLSLMGSELNEGKIQFFIIKYILVRHVKICIVKSQQMLEQLGSRKNVYVIPNGVDINVFYPIKRNDAIAETNLSQNKKYVLFASDPNRYEKNYQLAKESFERLSLPDFELIVLKNTEHTQMPYIYNAVEVVLLTSLWEGSPNVIKEAMACNRPIVTTKVGDVESIIGNTNGCYICNPDVDEIASALKAALEYKQTNGRKNIINSQYDSIMAANSIKSLYIQELND